MEHYEYLLVDIFNEVELNEQGKLGWRVISGSVVTGERAKFVLMERIIQPNIEYFGPCNASKSVGWGDIRPCVLDEGHVGEHQWGTKNV